MLSLYALLLPGAPAVADGEAYDGDRECRFCHGLEARQQASSDHGQLIRALRNDRGCETCHGPGVRHIAVAGDPLYRGPLHIRTAEALGQNDDVCLSCHENGDRMHWHVSAHAAAGLTCTSCHSIHQDRVAKDCSSCHRREATRLQRSSHMPVREGGLRCTSCHNPHGGAGEAALRGHTVNEVCHGCHADKRGPFLFEHFPVRDRCTLCHEPHGSNHRSLLIRRPPLLCQQCHLASDHVSQLYAGDELGRAGVPQARARACLNCHSRIHGSNHPSGARFQR